MHHRQSQRQAHTHHTHSPAPGYNTGYSGGYGHHPPPPAQVGYPGYAATPVPPQRGPPPGANPDIWHWFSAVDTDRSGSITVTELQSALVNGNWTKFDLDTVKMLMNIFDTDRSGTIGFNEFQGLWKYIQDWQGVFRHFDKDRSGSIDGHELSSALNSFGYNLSPQLLSLVEQKYASGPAEMGYGPPPGITFDRFVRACVVVKTLTEAFHAADTDRDGWIQINYDQFMKMVLSAP